MNNKNAEGYPATERRPFLASVYRTDCNMERLEIEKKHVLGDIAKITDTRSGLSEEFAGLNFELSYYRDIPERTAVA